MSAEQEQQQHPAIQDLLKGNGPVDQGYYSALGLRFTASTAGHRARVGARGERARRAAGAPL